MAAAKARMDAIAKSLTPQQAVIAWMQEAHQFDSVFEYVVWSTERPEQATNLESLIERVEIATRDRWNGEPNEKVLKKVHDAVRDTMFLYYLHVQVNEHFDAGARAISYMGLLLLEREPAARRETAGKLPADQDRCDIWQEDLHSHALEVFTLKAATEQLAKQYFANNQVLWKAFAEQLEASIRLINWIVGKREDALSLAYWSRRHTRGKRRLGDRDEKRPQFDFDLEALKKLIDAKELVKSLLDLAYAETLSFMGDRPAAATHVASMLRRRRDLLKHSIDLQRG